MSSYVPAFVQHLIELPWRQSLTWIPSTHSLLDTHTRVRIAILILCNKPLSAWPLGPEPAVKLNHHGTVRRQQSVCQQFAFGLWEKEAQYGESNAAHTGWHVHGGSQTGTKDHQRIYLEGDENEGAQRGHANGGTDGAYLSGWIVR